LAVREFAVDLHSSEMLFALRVESRACQPSHTYSRLVHPLCLNRFTLTSALLSNRALVHESSLYHHHPCSSALRQIYLSRLIEPQPKSELAHPQLLSSCPFLPSSSSSSSSAPSRGSHCTGCSSGLTWPGLFSAVHSLAARAAPSLSLTHFPFNFALTCSLNTRLLQMGFVPIPSIRIPASNRTLHQSPLTYPFPLYHLFTCCSPSL
jgi:hypothetical protein